MSKRAEHSRGAHGEIFRTHSRERSQEARMPLALHGYSLITRSAVRASAPRTDKRGADFEIGRKTGFEWPPRGPSRLTCRLSLGERYGRRCPAFLQLFSHQSTRDSMLSKDRPYLSIKKGEIDNNSEKIDIANSNPSAQQLLRD